MAKQDLQYRLKLAEAEQSERIKAVSNVHGVSENVPLYSILHRYA